MNFLFNKSTLSPCLLAGQLTGQRSSRDYATFFWRSSCHVPPSKGRRRHVSQCNRAAVGLPKARRCVTCRARCVHLCGLILPSVLKLTARGIELPGWLYCRVTASSDTVTEKHSRSPELFSSSILSTASTQNKNHKKCFDSTAAQTEYRRSECSAARRGVVCCNLTLKNNRRRWRNGGSTESNAIALGLSSWHLQIEYQYFTWLPASGCYAGCRQRSTLSTCHINRRLWHFMGNHGFYEPTAAYLINQRYMYAWEKGPYVYVSAQVLGLAAWAYWGLSGWLLPSNKRNGFNCC